MFVQVVHEVVDRDAWKNLASTWEGPPPGFTVHTSVSTQDGTRAFCLWEVESVDALSTILDAQTKGILKNTYYAIDQKAPLTILPQEAVSR